jgi:cold shock CspA family protein
MGNFSKVGDTWITGTIKILKPDKDFGFIRDQAGIEYFFHREQALDFDTFTVGMAVRFVPTAGTKGPRATNVEAL